METRNEPGTKAGAGRSTADPLQVRLNVTPEATEKLRDVLSKREAENQWIRIYPEGIS